MALSKVNKWTEAVDDTGYAAQQAAIRQDNLAGDVEKLGGAFDTAFIKTGSGANEVLRTMVQAATALVDIYGELPEPVQTTALVIGVATTAVLLFGGAAVGLRAKYLELKTALDTTNGSFNRTAILGGAAGLALTGVITVIALLAQQQAEARAKAQAYADTLEDGNNKITESTRDLAKANLATDRTLLWANFGSAFDNAQKLGISLDLVTDAATGNVSAMKELRSVLDVATGGGQDAQRMADELGISLIDLSQSAGTLDEAVRGEASSLDAAIEIQEQLSEVTDEGTEVTKTATEAYVAAASSADDLTSSLEELIEIVNEANGVGQDAITANIDYKDALSDVNEVIRKAKEGLDENTDGVADYTLTLDENTQAGRDNMDMLVEQASKAQDAADAQLAVDHNTDAYFERLRTGRQTLIDNAQAFGYSTEQAEALADQIFRIPSDVEVKAIVETSEAASRIDRLRSAIDSLKDKTVKINLTTPNGVALSDRQVAQQFGFGSANGNLIAAYANGGIEHYAGGGIRENHVAQMARGGAVRVWNEPETGGEAYIPLAPSKRARSVPILAETAAAMGYTIVPATASRFADGRVRGSRAAVTTAGRSGPLFQIIVNPTPGMNEDQLARKAAKAAVEEIERRTA
ncbi:hypothetical protein [Microbacterium sp. BR1]|uniref:hypothetical protein n=1 Tax=Microbacterium sp. BR1 TaxID=1070896 RepID=UPI000C2B62BE|nr:hypothetical protein [Microbacterium sp. BR1]